MKTLHELYKTEKTQSSGCQSQCSEFSFKVCFRPKNRTIKCSKRGMFKITLVMTSLCQQSLGNWVIGRDFVSKPLSMPEPYMLRKLTKVLAQTICIPNFIQGKKRDQWGIYKQIQRVNQNRSCAKSMEVCVSHSIV